jgi:hypothetical protein
MKYAIDTEFIDTPTCSALMSLAIAAEDGRELYMEFDYPKRELTPWLRQHVVPFLTGETVSFEAARPLIEHFITDKKPEFWAYYAAYDWYWFCRVFGGMLAMPTHYPMLIRDFGLIHQGIENRYGPEHHALNDAKSLMYVMKQVLQ